MYQMAPLKRSIQVPVAHTRRSLSAQRFDGSHQSNVFRRTVNPSCMLDR